MNNAWESFTTQLQQFCAHLEEQKTRLGGILVKQLDEFRWGGEGGGGMCKGDEDERVHSIGRSQSPPPPLRSDVAGFASCWHELKPKGGPSGNPAVVLTRIEEYATAIQELREESGKEWQAAQGVCVGADKGVSLRRKSTAQSPVLLIPPCPLLSPPSSSPTRMPRPSSSMPGTSPPWRSRLLMWRSPRADVLRERNENGQLEDWLSIRDQVRGG